MLRDDAVTRIQDGLGFASRQSDKIILRLQEAQRELERGKTLPKFLRQILQPLIFLSGVNIVALPTRFLRIDDEFKPFILTPEKSVTHVPIVRAYTDAVDTYYKDGEATGPKALVVLNTTITIVNAADQDYTIYWQYYKGAEVLTTNIENEWLASAPDWLIGEAGWRMAMDSRDKDAVTIFDNLRKTGRLAVFGEIVASEEASGPLVMGANF